jgi:hypothetical protein
MENQYSCRLGTSEHVVHGIFYIAVARIWVTVITSGVPVGVQIAWLLCTTSGWPFDKTRVEPVGGTHVAFTQGPLAAIGGGNVQPATR